jgi:glycosyltransferase involved in cell wall biosynthesis
MKRILFIMTSLTGGGAERVGQLLLNSLDKNVYSFKLILFNDVIVYDIPDNVEIISLQKRHRCDFFKLIWKLAMLLKKENPYVMISFLTYTNIIAVLAQVFSRRKGNLILSEHNNLFASLQNKRMRIIKKSLIKVLYPLADRIICVSDGIKIDLTRNYSIPLEKLRTIYNAADAPGIMAMTKEKPRHPWYVEEVPLLVSVGRLVKQKAYPDLLRAFAAVRRRTRCRLVIIGEGEEHKYLETLAIELRISDDVDFVGFQNNPFSFMAHSEIFVLSSHWEGFGNVIIEAMACGVPVISTDCPFGPNEIITDGVNGLLVPVSDVEAMAGAILALLQDNVLRSRLAEAGRKRAEDFSVNKMVTEYEKMFEDEAS